MLQTPDKQTIKNVQLHTAPEHVCCSQTVLSIHSKLLFLRLNTVLSACLSRPNDYLHLQNNIF